MSVWIPCSERFPEKDGKYLVTTSYGSIDICNYAHNLYELDRYDFAEYKRKKNKTGWYDYDGEWGYCECSIIAWMPLPEAYKEVLV